MLTDLYLSSLFLSLAITFFSLNREQAYFRLHKSFCLFLLLTCLIEIAGEVIKKQGIHNIWLMNIFNLIEFSIYSLFYRTQIKSGFIKRAIFLFLCIYPILFLVNVLFFQPLFTSFHTYTFLFGSLVMIIWACGHLYEQLTLEENLEENLLLKPFFWVSIGLLFFYTGTFIIFGSINYLLNASMKLASGLFKIVQVLNILMYALFAIGFSCHRIFRKYHF